MKHKVNLMAKSSFKSIFWGKECVFPEERTCIEVDLLCCLFFVLCTTLQFEVHLGNVKFCCGSFLLMGCRLTIDFMYPFNISNVFNGDLLYVLWLFDTFLKKPQCYNRQTSNYSLFNRQSFSSDLFVNHEIFFGSIQFQNDL